jgi:hypothetical protein
MSAILGLMVVNTLLPLLGIWWLIAPQRCGRAEWLAKAALVLAYLVGVALASVWLVPSVFAPQVYFALFAAALGISWLTARKRPWALDSARARTRFVAYLALAATFAAIGAYAWMGRAAPAAPAVALDFPLRDGRFYVASGGSNALVNNHLSAPPRYRGQSLALDIVAFDRLGQRAAGLLPSDPEAYSIFGMPVFAPCDGMAKHVVDGLPDQSPPDTDRERPAGNHVVLECGAVEVVLAHLSEGSIEVKAGQIVRRGDRLAAVGNSGNTSEPHLHVHAQRAGGADPLLDREPLAMTFDGRALSRGIVRLER